MTTATCTAVDRSEQVVHIEIAVNGEMYGFYAIRDPYMGCWRTAEPLDSDYAWTNEQVYRARYITQEGAMREVRRIRRYGRRNPCD